MVPSLTDRPDLPVRFVDTNILIYAVSPAPGEADKQQVAQQLLRADDLALSVQVLQEFLQSGNPYRSAWRHHP